MKSNRNYIRSLFVLSAAWNYHMSMDCATCARSQLDIKGAESLAQLGSFITGNDVSPSEFMKGDDSYSNEAIMYWNKYKEFSNYIIIDGVGTDLNNRFLKSFSQWSHMSWGGIDLKMYGVHFEYALELITRVRSGELDRDYAMHMFEYSITNIPFMKISKKRLMRKFIKLNREQDRIMEMVLERSGKDSKFK